MSAVEQNVPQKISGDIEFPGQWIVLGPLDRDDATIQPEALRNIPEKITAGALSLESIEVVPTLSQFDFEPFFGKAHQSETVGKTAYIFVPLTAERATEVTLGMGGDYWLQAWLNGQPLLGSEEVENCLFPPSITDNIVTVPLKEGENVLAVRLVAGKGKAILALGGPRELRSGDFRSIAEDPFNGDQRWSDDALMALPGTKQSEEIGSRRELFIDDFLIDAMTGAAERRLHHPVPREIVFTVGISGRPWEGNTGYPSMVEDEDGIKMYYSGRPESVADESDEQYTCVAESKDGIHFSRPTLGLHEFNGSKDNNIVWHGKPSHNFTPFRDPNPDAPDDQRYKAIAYHPGGGALGVYGAPDGIRWRLLADNPVITKGGFDSQNLAFWDSLRGRYVCFFRDNTYGLRRIATCTSEDFVNWTEPELVDYKDDREEQMYTNGIRPYARAPHLYIGTPARFVGERKKVPSHPGAGVSDAVLICSRDGRLFERWEEGFVRPGPEPEVWTERNNYPAWGMLQLTPAEISIYWSEHNRHPEKKIRRGTIRTDGFVSVHAGGGVGELLTRPLVFSGNRLEVNYATSAIGTILFELCDETGKPIEGFTLRDCEVLYGNELEHNVCWYPYADVSGLAGRPVRIRARLHDADWYSFRFGTGTL